MTGFIGVISAEEKRRLNTNKMYMYPKQAYLLAGLLLLSVSSNAQGPPADAPRPPSKEERLKHVTERMEKELKLSAAQKAKLSEAYKTFFNEMETLRKKENGGNPPPPPPPPPPKDKAAVDKLVKSRDAQVKSVLSAAQYQQYVELEKSMRPPAPGEKQAPPKPPKQ
jgi:hypothetical protein